MPRIERLQQNTPEWHRWRMQGIGASDAPVIMGETLFKTPRALWSIKTGRMQEEQAVRQRGAVANWRHSPVARTSDEQESRSSRCVWSTRSSTGCARRWTD